MQTTERKEKRKTKREIERNYERIESKNSQMVWHWFNDRFKLQKEEHRYSNEYSKETNTKTIAHSSSRDHSVINSKSLIASPFATVSAWHFGECANSIEMK